MAESPSPSPSPKALKSQNFSPSPSPITTIDQPYNYENYQPYVLVKGPMEDFKVSKMNQGETRSSKDRQKRSCFPSKPTLAEWFQTNKVVQSSETEKGGIGLDEASFKASSSSIPLMPTHPSKGIKCYSLQAKSLPTSPTKAISSTSRSLDDLRAAIQQMKDSSKEIEYRDEIHPYSHLPVELRFMEDYPSQDHILKADSVEDESLGRRLKRDHGKSPISHSLNYDPFCPVNVEPCDIFHPKVSTSQLYKQPEGINRDQSHHPSVHAPSYPPKHSISKSQPDLETFPPLHGSHMNHQIPQPTNPKTSWNRLFNSN